MDYRKPAVFGENWSPSRYKVLPYFAAEKRLLAQPDMQTIVEIGCGNGWNMSRFAQNGRRVIGLDAVEDRVRLAGVHGPSMLADGLQLPIASGTADMVYVQHVLHHIGNVQRALDEVWRVLRPGGVLFLVETIEDNPIIHWGRRLYPSWLGDEINAPFYFDELGEQLESKGFAVTENGRYSILFWLWEIMPDQIPAMERLTPAFVGVEQRLQQFWPQASAHCYFVARKPDDRDEEY